MLGKQQVSEISAVDRLSSFLKPCGPLITAFERSCNEHVYRNPMLNQENSKF